MIVLIILIALIVIGWIMGGITNTGFLEEAGFGLSFISSIILAIVLIALPVSHYNGKAEVERYYSLKDTIERSRMSDISDVERATITTQIVEYNKELASVKYWNDTIFDWWIYDGLVELDYLE